MGVGKVHLSLIGALSKPSEGEILVNGQNIAKLPDAFSSEYRHKHVGCIFQSFNLLNGLSVYHNVMAPLMLTFYYPEHRAKR